MTTKIHLDTDIGGDMDDLCALALLLKWSDAEITGVTTVAEERGRQAGYVGYVLKLAGREDIPFAAGADLAEGYFRYAELGYPPEDENWPEPIAPQPNPTDDSLELLRRSIDAGARIVAIGPFTNLWLLDLKYPGILARADLYLMGGYAYDLPSEYPQWDRHDDWNIQTDIRAARYVLEHSHPTLIPLTVTGQTALRRAYLPGLQQAGKLGALVARQAEVFERLWDNAGRFGSYPGLPDDIINFQHDPLACAIALGWREGVTIEMVPLRLEDRDGWLYEIPDPAGIPTRLVTAIDGAVFNDFWYDVLCR